MNTCDSYSSAYADRAVRLASTILYGDPRPEEPLEVAFARALARLGLDREPEAVLTDRLRARVIRGLRGEDERAKIAGVLDQAPTWMLRQDGPAHNAGRSGGAHVVTARETIRHT